jgi:protoheme IX farnesyltransferase
MGINESFMLASFMGIAGISILWLFMNPLSGLLGLFALILYTAVYTPLKRVTPFAVFVGAIPGAIPPMLGYVASSKGFGEIQFQAWILFFVQFMWQFPHFWAIAWVADDDYRKAGFKLLPSGGGKDHNTAIQIMTYTLFLLPLGLLPAWIGLTGINSALIATLCGTAFLAQTFSLMKTGSNQSAMRIMFGSFLYLPIVQIAYLLDKLK